MIYLVILILLILYLLITYFMFIIVSKKYSKHNYLKFIDENIEKEVEPYKEIANKGYRFVNIKESVKGIEDIFIKSKDGLKLHAIYIENKKAKGTIIECHGYRSSAKRDLYASVKDYHDLGFNILLIDQRCCNLSEGKYITFGFYESDDILKWIRYTNKRTNKGIILAGISMGATAVLLTSAKLKGKDNVKLIVADSAYSNGYDEVKYVIKHYFHIPSFIFAPMINVWCKKIAKFNLKKIDTIESINKSNIPTVLIHGSDDDFVPPISTIITNKKCENVKEILLIDNATHGMGYLVDKSIYLNFIKESINKYYK